MKQSDDQQKVKPVNRAVFLGEAVKNKTPLVRLAEGGVPNYS
jgi:hypothetical protein